jgi:ribonuclease HIII
MLLPPAEYNALILQYKNERKNLNDLLAWAHSAAIMQTVKGLGIISGSAIRVTIDKFAEDKMNLSLQKLEQREITIVQKIGGEEDIPVAAASIIAKSLFEEEVDRMCQTYGMDFRIMKTTDVPRDILSQVAKMHFKNVSRTGDK